MRHTLVPILVLAVFWLLNSGHYNGLLLTAGAASTLLVVFMAKRMGVIDSQSQLLRMIPRLPRYLLWLSKAIVYANIDVAYRVWRGTSAIDPVQKTLRISQETDIGRVIYANSITLTPGTVAIDLTKDTVTVHALTTEALDGLTLGEMDRQVRQLEVSCYSE